MVSGAGLWHLMYYRVEDRSPQYNWGYWALAGSGWVDGIECLPGEMPPFNPRRLNALTALLSVGNRFLL